MILFRILLEGQFLFSNHGFYSRTIVEGEASEYISPFIPFIISP